MKKFVKSLLSLAMSATLLTACSSGAGQQAKTDNKGKDKPEISFMIPEYGAPSDEMLTAFEKESGIKVKVMKTSWDDIRDKISTAAVGKKAAADVYEVDWSWVGEFQAAGWLDKLEVDAETQKDIPSLETFKVGKDYYAIPYSNEYRMAYYNTKSFKAAGLDKAPSTFKEVLADAKALKEKAGVEYPVALPMAADENTSTSFFTLNYARNGKVFNDDNTLNKENALDTLRYIDALNKAELINPSYRTTNEGKYQYLQKGEAVYAVAPSFYAIRCDSKENSSVVGQVNVAQLPGKEGLSDKTVSYVEAVGVSPYSKNKEAAKKFVQWYTQKKTQEQLFKVVEILPTRTSALEAVVAKGEIRESKAMLEMAQRVQTPFPHGVPKYYTEMSTTIFNTINEMANGKLTPEQAADKMVEKIDALVKQK
ncbi:extracellular solute-binding protein [Atopobacter sp. AH10]|uniref:sugar ABC transporter substrate-binding protein n=1 Tax=Atopobacter sp. AH10 TaxID=2315861 RepID=UPI000EF266A6|nr:extracellular solute-binding protein [Atopobacter sp. AH10]RLK63327.1 extracellular solute-binding protein [Atopobacter sp. AH10]